MNLVSVWISLHIGPGFKYVQLFYPGFPEPSCQYENRRSSLTFLCYYSRIMGTIRGQNCFISMKRTLLLLSTSIVLLSAAVFNSVSCSSQSNLESTQEKQKEPSSLNGTTLSGSLLNKPADYSFTEKEVTIKWIDSDTPFEGTYSYKYPNISIVAHDDSRTVSATGVVEDTVIKLRVTFKNTWGDTKYYDDIIILN